jgi:outer membrane usher protein
MNTKIAGALALVLFGAAATANAATDTKNFNVTLTITSTCDIHTGAATDVAFGTVASTAVNTDAGGNLIVNCTPNTSYNIGLGFGLTGTDVNTRVMTNGSVNVPYQL